MKLLIAVLTLFSANSFAVLSPLLTIEGKVVRFDEKKVVIKVGKKKVQVPREYVINLKGTGEDCTALVERDEITLVK